MTWEPEDIWGESCIRKDVCLVCGEFMSMDYDTRCDVLVFGVIVFACFWISHARDGYICDDGDCWVLYEGVRNSKASQ